MYAVQTTPTRALDYERTKDYERIKASLQYLIFLCYQNLLKDKTIAMGIERCGLIASSPDVATASKPTKP